MGGLPPGATKSQEGHQRLPTRLIQARPEAGRALPHLRRPGPHQQRPVSGLCGESGTALQGVGGG